MYALICDDQEAARKLLFEYCERYAAEHALHIRALPFAGAEELLQCAQLMESSVAFLDIYMPGMGGVSLAHRLRELGYAGAMVFTTSSRDHYAEGFNLGVAHYLLKPVDYEQFKEAMRRALKNADSAAKSLRVRSGRVAREVPLSHILYLEVYNHQTMLHTSAGAIPVGQPLSALESALAGPPFLRCYRSYIINMDYVDRMEGDCFLLKNGARIPIARDRRQELQRSYMAHIFAPLQEE